MGLPDFGEEQVENLGKKEKYLISPGLSKGIGPNRVKQCVKFKKTSIFYERSRLVPQVFQFVSQKSGQLSFYSHVQVLVSAVHKPKQTSYTDDAIILLNFIFTSPQGYQITPGLSTNKQRDRLLLLKTGIPVARTHP